MPAASPLRRPIALVSPAACPSHRPNGPNGPASDQVEFVQGCGYRVEPLVGMYGTAFF